MNVIYCKIYLQTVFCFDHRTITQPMFSLSFCLFPLQKCQKTFFVERFIFPGIELQSNAKNKTNGKR